MASHSSDTRSAIVAPTPASTQSTSGNKKVTKRIRKGLHKLGKSGKKLGKSTRRLMPRRGSNRSRATTTSSPTLADIDLTSIQNSSDTSQAEDDNHHWHVNLPKYLPYSSLDIPSGKMAQLKCTPNTYTDVPASQVTVRGPHYLEGKNGVAPSSTSKKEALKVSSQESAYECVGFHIFRSGHHDLLHAASKVQSLKSFLAREHAKKQEEKTQRGLDISSSTLSDAEDEEDVLADFPEFLVTSFALSAMFKKDYTAVVQVFRIRPEIVRQDPAFRTAFSRFMKAESQVKNQKLKFKTVVHDAPSSVKRTVAMTGGERPAIMGKKLRTTYYEGANYLEVDMDVGSSTIAKMLNSVVLKSCGGIMLDFHYILEAQNTDELPERVLGGVRINYVDINKVSVNLDANGNAVNPAHKHVSAATSSTTTSKEKRSSKARHSTRDISRRSSRGSASETGEGGVLDSISWMWGLTTEVVVSSYEVVAAAVGSVVPTFSQSSQDRDSVSREEEVGRENPSFRGYATTGDL